MVIFNKCRQEFNLASYSLLLRTFFIRLMWKIQIESQRLFLDTLKPFVFVLYFAKIATSYLSLDICISILLQTATDDKFCLKHFIVKARFYMHKPVCFQIHSTQVELKIGCHLHLFTAKMLIKYIK